jgi:hypothetical protein
MNEYAPDAWQVIEIKGPNETIHKLFSTWYGGYLSGDAWKLNSGITSMKKVGKVYEVTGASGSIYRVPNHEHCYCTSAYTNSVLANLIEKSEYEIKVLPYDTDWENLV